MKHCIIIKWNQLVENKEEMLTKVHEAFGDVITFEGCESLNIYPNCNDRKNRYDLMVVITCNEKGLEIYDKSELHCNWKSNFSKYIESKAVFDYEE